MKTLIVGMADGRISNERDSLLITYALGSCVAVALYDPLASVAGMVHYMLPDSSLDREKALARPWMFADTGIAILLDQLKLAGAVPRRMKVYLAGGAQVLDGGGFFEIGKRNYLAARKLLWKAGLLVQAEDVGGGNSRTVSLQLDTGRFTIRSGSRQEKVL
ncbi:MAG: chemotaxis protein CheD [Acidobacteria bacterium]|nr:chemotaxis protein CheD [Acidobacteriota bacterium]